MEPTPRWTPADGDGGALAAEETARSVFVSWELLRLVYNGVLAFLVLCVAASQLRDGAFRAFLFRGALGANVCFCLGPVAEGYLVLAGVERRFARLLVFLGGVALAGFLTFLAILGWLFRGMD